MTLSEAKEIAKTIHEYVEEKRQEPTGNQNCLLCVWCSEARFRGFRVLPRPVYSPRDSIFKHHEHGLDIVHDAVKESISSIDDIKKKCVNDARYYCHVNWKDSKGGHEFLLIVIDDEIYVMDSQANTVAPITSEDGEYYFNDINWDNSFIARIDDKKLNKSLLFRENSMMKVLPWDEEADVKFLIDNGMVSSELTLPEGISIRKAMREDIEYVYECELETSDQEEIQKQEKRDEIMEDAKDSIEHTQIIMRGSNKIGIYQAYKTNQYGMKQEPYDWWYIAEIYIEPAYRSMGIGSALIKRDIEIHGKIMLHVLLSNKRAIKLYESLGFEKDQENGYGGLIMRIDKSKVIKEAYEHDYSGDMKLPDGVGFRRATENDVSDIYTWRLEAIAKRLRDNEQAKQYVMDDTKRHLDDAYIITYNGKDVGVYVGYKIDDGWWYISTIHILKEYRGQGIGSAIMRRDCAYRNKICLRVDPHNTRARKFYKSLGFRVTDKSNKASYVMRYEKGKRLRSVQEGFVNEKTGLIPVKDYPYDTVYMGTPTEKIPKKDVYFVTPYMSTASIFIGRDKVVPILRDKGLHNYNLNYEEWGSKDKKPLKTVHIKVNHSRYHPEDSIPYFEPFEFEATGYLHTIDLSKMKDHIYVYDWMSKEFEAIVSDVDELDVIKTEKVTIKYYVTWDDSEHKNSEDVYRIEYSDKKIGIYEALKQAMIKDDKSDEWKKFLNNPDVKKLPEPPEYKEGYESWFTEKGKVEVWDKIKDIFFEYLDRSKFHFTKRSIERIKKYEIVYSDEYQYVIDKNKSIQESSTDDAFSKIQEFFDSMKDFEYGFYADGKVYTGDILDEPNIFEKHYHLMSSEEVEQYKVCVCWDACRYEAEWFKNNLPDVEIKAYYCEYEPKIGNTHTWLVFKLDGKWYVFEYTWYNKRNLKEISSPEALADEYIRDIPLHEHSPSELKDGKYVLIEYDPLQDKPGISCVEFMDHKWYKGTLIKTNCKSEEELIDTFEFTNEEVKPKFKINPMQ